MARQQSCCEKGFTLIEAMVALLVLAIGLLGLSMMQVKSMKSTHVAYQRSLATIAAQDMVERLWIELGRGAPASTACPEATDLVSGSSDTILEQWHDEWIKAIPSLIVDDDAGSGTVVKNDSVACQYVITVMWTDARFGDEDVSSIVYVASLLGTET